MRVSLDIDGLLTPFLGAVELESPVWPEFIVQRLAEPLRFGARRLISELDHMGCDVWIYTTSTRSKSYVQLWLRMYGIRVSGVINADVHVREVQCLSFTRIPSKYPPLFGIQLHVDDSPGLLIEGKENGFDVIIVSATDGTWVEKVISEVSLRLPAGLAGKSHLR